MKTLGVFFGALCLISSLSVSAQTAPSKDKKPDAKAIIIIDNPKALADAVGSQDPNNDNTIIERVNPKPGADHPESSPSAPPLATDDTGTPGPGGIEVNLIANCDRSHTGRSCEQVVDANFGVGEKMEISFVKGLQQQHGFEAPDFRGVGQTEVGLKYRFYDKNGLSMAVYPSYTFNDATKAVDADGNRDPGEGNSVYIPLIISKETGKFTTVANVGYRRNFMNHEDDRIVTSLAVGRSISETSRLMAEVYSERDRSFHNERTDVRVGWVKVINAKESSKYETSIFTSVGRSIGHTEDGKPHTTVMFGISIARKPRS